MSALPFREGLGVGFSIKSKFVFTLAKFLIIVYFCD